MPEKLTRRQVDLVLRRAAELEKGRTRAAEGDGEAELSFDEVRRLGAEAGLGEASLARALTELGRGALIDGGDEPGLARVLGSNRIVITREVPGSARSVRRALFRFMREQLMTVSGHDGDRIQWERARGIWPGLARSLDFSRRYAFGLVTRIETAVAAAGDAGASITFLVDVSDLRREVLARIGLRAAMAFGVVGLGGVALSPASGWYDAIALSGGALLAGGLAALEQRRFAEARDRMALASERFLDRLATKPRRG